MAESGGPKADRLEDPFVFVQPTRLYASTSHLPNPEAQGSRVRAARRLPLSAVGLLLVALVLFAGCGGAREAPGVKTVRLFILFISPQQAEYFRWAERTFEARNPGTDVIIEQFPGTSLKDYEIKLRLRFASRREPDLMLGSDNVIAPLARLGLLDPAPETIVRRVETNSLNDLVRRAPYVADTCYGIATDAAWQALYYNKTMFRAAGLDPERPPATWPELLAAADRLTVRRRDGSPERAGFSLRKTGFKPGTAEKWFTFVFSAGGAPFSPDGTRATLNTPEARAALDFYQSVLDRRIDSIGLEGDQQGFGQGRVAMFFREAHVVRWMRENHPDVDFGVAPLPAGARSRSSGGAYVMSVAKASKHRDVAWAFIDFLTTDEAYGRYVAIGGILPVMRSIAERPEVRADSQLAVFLKQPAASPGNFPLVQRASEITGAYLERFLYGLMTRDEMLARAERDVNAVLEANRDE